MVKRWGTVAPALIGLGLILCSGHTVFAEWWRLPMSATMPHRAFSEQTQDGRFVEEAAQGAMYEIEQGKLAMKQAATESVRDYARRVVDEHRMANNELASYAMKRQIDIRPKLGDYQRETLKRLSGLSGSEFDRAYLAEQVKSHRKSVELYKKEADYGQDGYLRMWASNMLPALRSHENIAWILSGGGAPTTSSSSR